MKQLIAGFVVALVVAAGAWASPASETASAASDGPKYGGTLDVAIATTPHTLDWQSTVSHPLPHIMGHVFEGLFGFTKEFDAAPELAESWETNADGTVWTIRLRTGVMFHNGDELMADDVVASLERWRRVGPKGPALDELEQFEIIDDHTLAMHFSSPKGRFLLLLLGSDENKAVIMPKEVAEASPEGGTLSEVVGTGPYRFVEYREDQYVRLERFADYSARDDAPNYQTGNKIAYPDELLFWIVPEASTRIAGLEAGEYDIISNVPDAEFQRLQGTDGVVPVKNGPGVLLYMMFNHQHGPTADLNFRRAVQAIVDAQKVVDAAMADPEFATVNPSFYPPESAYNTDACAELYNQVDADKAREYLAASNYDGEKVIVQTIASSASHVRTGLSIAEQLQSIGINAEMVQYDVQTWVAKRRDPNELNIYTSGGYWIDPSLYHPEFNGTFPSTEVGYYHDETEEVFRGLAAETDFDKRYALGEALQCEFYNKVATINVGYQYRLVAHRDTVRDPEGYLALGNPTLHHVWLDE